MKTVLITGAAGFLGCNLTKRYLEEDCFVIGMDDFCTSNRNSPFFLQNRQHPNFLLIDGDVRDNVNWQRLITNSAVKLDLILNFACPASPVAYQRMPIKTLLTSVLGTQNALDAARFFRCPMIQASTSEVYGDPTVTPQVEEYRGNVNCYGIRANYDEGKRTSEALCFDYIHQYEVDARIVRIFNTYGPGLQIFDGRVVSNMICQALQNRSFTIYGDGSQNRSFCYVDDLVEYIHRVGELANGELKGPINIGNENTFTMMELAAVVSKCVGIIPNINYESLPSDDPTTRKPDLTKAKNLLKYEAQVQLEEGIKRSIPWFKQCLLASK